VLQRTPSQINARDQRDTDPKEWRETIASTPGWQKRRNENFAEHLSGHIPPGVNDLVNDGCSNLESYCAMVGSRKFGIIAPEKAQEHIRALTALDVKHSAATRQHVARVVKDKQTAQKLTPWFSSWCRRPTFSDTYLQTFNDNHVHLIDTDGKGIEKVT
jgi:cation diffusion facilitator CzcD-associated flavoprotein CzcO